MLGNLARKEAEAAPGSGQASAVAGAEVEVGEVAAGAGVLQAAVRAASAAATQGACQTGCKLSDLRRRR